MKNWVMILSLVAAMMLAACEQREETVATQPSAEREGQVAGEPVRPPVTTDQETASQPPAGQPSAERDIAGTPSATVPPGDTMSRPDTAQPQTPPGATSSRESSEFLGQSPEFGNAPETIILKASNGNVTLSHKKHAGIMECKTCHGDGTPGPIEGFSKDQAHSLCTGCHKEKAAGPTKCQECHKKQ